jgi:ketosteroid isomerase-like protein
MERIAAAEGDEIHSSLAQATNIFLRHDDRWRLAVHHASPVPYMPPPVPGSGSLVN